MTERPILFNGDMVRAILDGLKTQTRRVVTVRDCQRGLTRKHLVDLSCATKDNSWAEDNGEYLHVPFAHPDDGWTGGDGRWRVYCPYGVPGDRLWVRETFQWIWADAETRPASTKSPEGWKIGYVATDGVQEFWNDDDGVKETKSPSIHMPRWASRITLEITGIRVERLQDISEADAKAEGVDAISQTDVPRQATWNRRQDFMQLWNSINGPDAWDRNDWVWVIEFKRIESEATQ